MCAIEKFPLPALTTDHDDDSRFPIVFATPTKRGSQLKYLCPCGRHHLHGRPEVGDGTTPFRESHCQDPSSPLYDATYRVVEVEPGDHRLNRPSRGRKTIQQ